MGTLTCASPRCERPIAERRFCRDHADLFERLRQELHDEGKAKRKGGRIVKRRLEFTCRIDGCNHYAVDDVCPEHEGITVVEEEAPAPAAPKPAEPDTDDNTCRLNGCENRAQESGAACYFHRSVPDDLTEAPALPKRTAQGSCGWGCGRSARKGRNCCPPCEEAGALVSTCAAEGCNAAAKAGFCGRHKGLA